jgi:hypothetical protein
MDNRPDTLSASALNRDRNPLNMKVQVRYQE